MKSDCNVIRRMIETPNSCNDVLLNERLKFFTKSNEFIHNFITSMSRLELKLVDYIMANAYYSNDCSLEYTFSISDFCAVAGISISGSTYIHIKNALKNLRSKSEWASKSDRDVLVGFINKAEFFKQTGIVKLYLDEDMRSFVFESKKAWELKGIPYTKFLLLYLLPLKSKYARLLYELLKSWECSGKRYYSISQLQQYFNSDYDRYADFRRYVLDIAVSQINASTDIEVSYEPIKEGRSYKYIMFYINSKSNIDLLNVKYANNRELDGQLSFFNDVNTEEDVL